MLSLEHWGNAVAQAEVAAHNMISPGPPRRPHLAVPVFWSSQFGVNIKSVGVPTYSDQVVIAQGSLSERRLVAVSTATGAASLPPSPSTWPSGWSTTRA